MAFIDNSTFKLVEASIRKIKASNGAAPNAPFFQSYTGFCQLIPCDELPAFSKSSLLDPPRCNNDLRETVSNKQEAYEGK